MDRHGAQFGEVRGFPLPDPRGEHRKATKAAAGPAPVEPTRTAVVVELFPSGPPTRRRVAAPAPPQALGWAWGPAPEMEAAGIPADLTATPHDAGTPAAAPFAPAGEIVGGARLAPKPAWGRPYKRGATPDTPVTCSSAASDSR
jgi:hypothetical protein